MTIQHSTVKWFDAKKGYGFINHPDGGDDVFIHYSQIDSDDDFKTLRTGQSVQFEMNDGPKGLHAVNVRALDEEEDGGDAPDVETIDSPAPALENVKPVDNEPEPERNLEQEPDHEAPDEGATPAF
ncbi:cold-shock protein [Longibacter sp.]|uniref:cold-shock protein n=1 Tax=Longibacter sp. TaxID=2045415 RepID=UPI003EBEB18D